MTPIRPPCESTSAADERGLRIAIVHSYYTARSPSGENTTVDAERAALAAAGHDVELFAARTDDLAASPTYPVRAALRVATHRGANPLDDLETYAPDVVHVHNLFPNFGRRWVRDIEPPVVHTLHNFRPVCINGLLLRDGALCTACPDGDRWAGVRHRCYRDSVAASIPVAWGNRRGAGADPLLRRADRIVTLSRRHRELLVADGVPAAKLVPGHNFLPDALRPPLRSDAATPDADAGGPWLCVGRLSPEKGVVELLDGWPAGEPLSIIGDGPLRDRVASAAAAKGVDLLGPLDRTEVLERLAASSGLVFPSLALEGAPLVYPEALACGVPVVAFEPSAVADAVRADGTGAVATRDPEGIAAALRLIRERRHELGRRCRAVFEARHTEAAFVRRTVELYSELLGTGPA